MQRRCLAVAGTLAAVGAMVSLGAAVIAAQTASAVPKSKASSTWTPPRTADGQPDLQGVWDFRTITPLERPTALGDKAVLSDQEAAEFERAENRRQNRDLIDPAKGGVNYPPGGVVPYNEFWYDRGNKIVGPNRTSLIVDPPNGRLPPRTPEGERRAAARAAEGRDNQVGRPRADSHEDRPLSERCIIGFNAGPPMTPGAYNNNVQIFQAAGQVAILNEMVHDVRIIPLDGRPSGKVRQGMGVSRGRWDGDTLVVDTTNFARETSLEGSSADMRLVERFTRTAPDTLLYEFTVTQPTEWTRPWTAQLFMVKSADGIYEYACHEGNYGLAGVLGGARAEEKASAAAAKK
ncbi:MAG: hypothetical protein GEU82_00150 [Luteitalea sp.]|nr:hypothetical protein [Luteitalea sp.]